MYGYTLLVYKKDRRCQAGERLVETRRYENYSGHAMMEEIKDLRYMGYPKETFRLDFEALPENWQFN